MHKKFAILLAIALVLSWFVVPAIAGSEEMTITIESMVITTDKNGQEYVRFIVPMTLKTKNGVEYPDSFPFMAFGKLVEQAKTYKAGDTLTVVAKSRIYQDRKSYTILKFQTETASQ